MRVTLDEICTLACEKANVDSIEKSSYVSTESMLPNKGGISSPSSIPDKGKVTRYRKGDTLISNIRPYFKKIWHADKNGGCSNDVLVLRPSKSCDSDYLYWALSDDAFFDYMTATSKGTKMPRGDKAAIMRYQLPKHEKPQQLKIAALLQPLQEQIILNNQTNGYLEELIDSKFSEDFGNGCPLVKLGEVLRISTESVNPRQHAEEMWEHYSIPAFDNSHQPTFELASNIKSNKYVVSRNSILISKLNPSIKRFWLPACSTQHAVCSTEFIVYETKNPAHKSFYAAALSSDVFQKYLLAHVTGSTGSRQRTQPKSTLEYPMPHPSEADIDEFCAFADPIYTRIECNERESAGLSQLRNALLPKLMSGEIDVSKVEVPTQPNSHLSGC